MGWARGRWKSEWFDIRGNRLRVRVIGNGPPLLFLHGYPETSLTWRHAFDALHDRYTCLAPDLAGWGESQGCGRLTLPRLLDDAVELIRALRRGPPVVVGHDWGAALAYGLGAYHPEAVRRIVTVNFSPGRFQLTRPLHFYFFALPLLPELVLRLWPERVVPLLLRWWAARPERFPPEVLKAYQRAARTRKARRATVSYYRHMVWRAALGKPPFRMGPTGRNRRNPAVPWDVIWGMRDPVATPKVLAMLKQEFPTLRVLPIQDAGHFPQEEAPEEFLAALERILASDRPAREAAPAVPGRGETTGAPELPAT